MKSIKRSVGKLVLEERWDIDYHLPAIEIGSYSPSLLTEVRNCADVVAEKRNPTLKPKEKFKYVDISSIDVTTGTITAPQTLLGADAPSRARKVIKEGDLLISTVRPTRGAIAIVTKELDNQICSTGFSVIRPNDSADVKYLHFILRSELVKEQFRKFSTGSSYPAILDSDIEKTVIPLPSKKQQLEISKKVFSDTEQRNKSIIKANKDWVYKMNNHLESIKRLK